MTGGLPLHRCESTGNEEQSKFAKEYSAQVESELQRPAQLSNTVESKGNKQQSKFAKKYSVQVESELQTTCTVIENTIECKGNEEQAKFTRSIPSVSSASFGPAQF